MNELIELLSEYSFIQNALLAGILSAIACGIAGTFVVVKKISYIGGGIAHAVMGGLGLAYFIGINPLYGALVFALFAAMLIGWVKLHYEQNEDTVISALWAIGMAVGIIFAYLTPGYNVNLLSFLFGNILMISREDLWLLLGLDLLILAVTFTFFKQFVFVCFDQEYAKLRGININFIYLLLLTIIALTIVILVQSVGLILVIALLTLPSAIAGMFSSGIRKMILLSIGLIFVFILSGLGLSFYANLPAGASIILLTGIAYVVSFFIKGVSHKRIRIQ